MRQASIFIHIVFPVLELSKDCQKCSHSTLQYVFERVHLYEGAVFVTLDQCEWLTVCTSNTVSVHMFVIIQYCPVSITQKSLWITDMNIMFMTVFIELLMILVLWQNKVKLKYFQFYSREMYTV